MEIFRFPAGSAQQQVLVPDRGAEKQVAILGLMDPVDKSQLLHPAKDPVYGGQSKAGAMPPGGSVDFLRGERLATGIKHQDNGVQRGRGAMPVLAQKDGPRINRAGFLGHDVIEKHSQ